MHLAYFDVSTMTTTPAILVLLLLAFLTSKPHRLFDFLAGNCSGDLAQQYKNTCFRSTSSLVPGSAGQSCPSTKPCFYPRPTGRPSQQDDSSTTNPLSTARFQMSNILVCRRLSSCSTYSTHPPSCFVHRYLYSTLSQPWRHQAIILSVIATTLAPGGTVAGKCKHRESFINFDAVLSSRDLVLVEPSSGTMLT